MLCWSRVLLLLCVLLLAAATEDSEEQQKEHDEPEHLNDDDDRGAPQDVTVTAVSESALRVSWEPPSEDPDYYSIAVDTEPGVPVYNTSYILEGLESCTEYEVSVASEYGHDEYLAEPVLGKTLDIVPPSPLSCLFDNITSNAMVISWDKPHFKCSIMNYSVSWSWNTLWKEANGSGEVFTTELTANLTDLLPYANVTADVAAATKAGFGLPTTCWNVTLQERGAPQDVTVTAVSESALRVSWDPPSEDPDCYNIAVDTEPAVSVYNTSYILEGLEPCTRLSVSVASEYGNDEHMAPPVMGKTLDSLPPSPLSCLFDNITSNAMVISWDKPHFTCFIMNYSVSWSWNTLWKEANGSGEVFTTELTAKLPDIPPYANVTVDVAAATKAGFGLPTTCWNVTLQEKPGKPIIDVITPYEGSASITWSPPEKINGVILNYDIFTIKGNTKSNQTVKGTVLMMMVEGLEPCKTYSFTVRASTEPGHGPMSDALSTIIYGNYPPSNVTCSVDEANDNVEMFWESSRPYCPVSNYSINWNGTVLWSNQTLSDSELLPWLNKTERSFQPRDSVPYTYYTMCVSVWGHTNESTCCSEVSPESVPDAPVLQDLQVHRNSLTVSWIKPVKENGKLDEYRVNWHNTNGSTGQDPVGAPICEDVIKGVQVCENYTVTVQAHTGAEWSSESKLRTAVITNYISESGLNCCNEETRQVELSWSLATSECLVSRYNLYWNTTVIWSQHTSSQNITIAGSETSHVLHDLEPYTKVFSCLNVVDKEDESTCCSITTQEEEASAPKDLKVLSKTQHTASVNWSLPESLNGELKGWHLNLTLDNEVIYEANLSGSSTQYTFNNLQPSTEYNVSIRAYNGAGLGAPAEIIINTVPTPPSHVGMIAGASVGGVLILVVLVAGGIFVFKKIPRKSPSSPGINLELDPSDKDAVLDMYQRQNRSYKEQRYMLKK
ncbi:collagen alpha-1(XII) chain-like [Homarus americanus]|uniref:collagen alpha-1(XII) chain-like n=1 Tax=Homarus americanus TaxID=6706 RepID=UPI001C444982|nr:collagen alpha-1(XII) chain-like [Homarus americanus]